MHRMGRVANIAVFVLLVIAFPRSLQAIDWQPIAPEDLALKDNPKQPGADAMVLYREVVINASKAPTNGDNFEEYVRIKVFTQAGVSRGHVNIEFVKEIESVPYIAGRTIRPDGSIVKFDGQVLETTIVKSSGIKVLAKTFTLPDVQPGCIVEYIYQRQTKQGFVMTHSWQVSQSMYTREAHFTYIPLTGYNANINRLPMYRPYMLPADAVLKEQINGSYTMAVHDMAGVVEEPLMPPESAIEPRVTFYYQGDGPSATDPPDHYWGYYAKKWDGELEHFIDKKNALNAELSKLVSPGDSPEVKLRKIYAGVLQIRNLNMEDYKSAKEHKDENLKDNNNVEDVLNRGYANANQINYLFVGLARGAGFEAAEIHVAPRNATLFVPTLNDVSELRAAIVWVDAGSHDYYLAPGSRYFRFGLLPWYDTGTGGIKADKHSPTVDIPNPPSADATIVRHADLEISAGGSISGALQVDFTGQQAALLREDKRKEDDTGRTKDLEDQIRSWLPAGSEFSVTKIANWDDVEQPVHVEGTLKIPSFASSAAQRLLMPLELFQMSQTSEFASEKRNNLVYFHYPYEEIDDLKLRMPAGYKVESLPPARKVDLKAVACEITADDHGDTVEIKRRLAVHGVVFTKDEYATLRKFFGIVRNNDNAQMVLQNATAAKNN